MDGPRVIAIVSAHDEADRIGATIVALREGLEPGRIVVADDASRDATAAVAGAHGAEVVTAPRNIGKGGATTLAARTVAGEDAVFVLCDGDLGESAAALTALVTVVAAGEADLAVAVFRRRLGGGFGVAVGFARWVIRRFTGLTLDAPISGQRAMTAEVLAAVLPFAARFGMEIGMTVDASRAGFRIGEVPLELTHRATGRDLRGFAHRARQLADFAVVAASRVRQSGGAPRRRGE